MPIARFTILASLILGSAALLTGCGGGDQATGGADGQADTTYISIGTGETGVYFRLALRSAA